jgi:hypothetical protein
MLLLVLLAGLAELQSYEISDRLESSCTTAGGGYASGTAELHYGFWGAQKLPSRVVDLNVRVPADPIFPTRANAEVVQLYGILLVLTTVLVIMYIFYFGVREKWLASCLGRVDFVGDTMGVRYIECVNIKAYVPTIRLAGMGGQKLINDLLAVDIEYMSVMHQVQVRRAKLPILTQDRLLLELLRDAATAQLLSETSSPSSPSSSSSAASASSASSSSATNPGMAGDGMGALVESRVQAELKRIFGSFRFFAPSVLATASMGERGSDVFQTIARELTQFVPANGPQVAGKMFAAVDRARKRSLQPNNLGQPAAMQNPAAVQHPAAMQQPAAVQYPAAAVHQPAATHQPPPTQQLAAMQQPPATQKTFKTGNLAKYKLHSQVRTTGDSGGNSGGNSSMDGWWVVSKRADAGGVAVGPGSVTLSSVRPTIVAVTMEVKGAGAGEAASAVRTDDL